MTKPGTIYDRIAGFYDSLVRQHGHSPQACHYGRAASQAVKFQVLSEIMPLAGKTILDVGCGFADFADYLERHHKNIRYSGIDLSPRMVRQAKKLHPGLDIRQGNILDLSGKKFDLVTCNGIFYLLGKNADLIMRRMVRKMYDLAEEAVAFNSLSAWAPDKNKREFYADPVETLRFCRSLTPRLQLRHDYHKRDFTVYLFKKRLR